MHTATHIIIIIFIAQILTQPPGTTTAALGTNATFTCRGNGRVLWQINGTQFTYDSQVSAIARVQVFVPLPRDGFSELIVTATRVINATLVIICVVDPGIGMGNLVRSDPVRLLIYGKCLSMLALMLYTVNVEDINHKLLIKFRWERSDHTSNIMQPQNGIQCNTKLLFTTDKFIIIVEPLYSRHH